jgi:hypothetical protein
MNTLFMLWVNFITILSVESVGVMSEPNQDIDETDSQQTEDQRSDAVARRIEENMDDGGGCTEAWAAARRLRESAPEPIVSSRRSFIGGIVASVVFGATAAQGAAAEETTSHAEVNPEQMELKTESEGLSDRATEKLFTKIQEQPEVPQVIGRIEERLDKALRSHSHDSFELNVDRATARRVIYEEAEWKFIHIPYSTPVPSVDAGLVWTNREGRQPYGYVSTLEKRPDHSVSSLLQELPKKNSIDYEAADVQAMEHSVTTIEANDGATTSNSFSEVVPIAQNKEALIEQATNESVETSNVTSQNIYDCACFLFVIPKYQCTPCGTWDLGCLYLIAEEFAAEIAICGTCTATRNKTPCVACAGYAVEYILGGDYEHLCCPCDTY